MLNQYLTNIFIFKNNLCNLYFNLIGEGSNILLDELENNINSINSLYNSLIIQIKKIGGYPIMNLDEIKNISSIKEISSKNYTIKEASNILLNDLSIINNMNNQVGEYSLKNYDLSSINLVLEFNKYLSKSISFFKINNLN